MKKKAISILLTAAMAMSAVPAYAEATTEGAGAATGAATTPQAPDWTEYNQLIQEIYTDTDLDDREARMHQAEDMPFAGGSGAGVSVKPVGFLVCSQNGVRLLSTEGQSPIERIVELIPQALEGISASKTSVQTAQATRNSTSFFGSS